MAENLEEKYQKLLTEVTRFSKVRQELVLAKTQIDEELEKYEAISEFSKNALQLESFSEVRTIALESIIEAFQLEFSIFFSLEGHVLVPIETFGVNQGDIKPVDFNPDWEKDPTPVIIGGDHILIQSCPSIQIHQAICGPIYDTEGELTGIILSGITIEGMDFYEEMNNKIVNAYSVILQQIGAIHHIFFINETLETKVEDRTKELAEQKQIVEERNVELKDTLQELARVKLAVSQLPLQSLH